MRNKKTMVMIQIMDISKDILYDQQRAENELLSLINACVSHELRNPLNSVIAQNILKAHLYEKLEKIKELNDLYE